MTVKRMIDIVVSIIALVVLSPVFIIIAVAIKLDSPGPVIFKGQRVGLLGKPFYIRKFRSMVENAPAKGAAITAKDDPRITRIGHFIRKTKIDELPSFWNVLIGEMSLVGPRPESPSWVEKYTAEQRKVLDVKPGITGMAQIKYRDEESMLDTDSLEQGYLKIMDDKIAIDLDYIQRQSVWLDLLILFKTIVAVLA